MKRQHFTEVDLALLGVAVRRRVEACEPDRDKLYRRWRRLLGKVRTIGAAQQRIAATVRCSVCKSTNVQLCMWVDPNTNKVHDMYSSDYECAQGRFSYCGDCEEHTLLEDDEVAAG